MDKQTNHDEEHVTISENIETLFESIKEYGETHIDLVKLKVADRATDIISSLVSNFLVLLALSMLLGELFGKTYYGFFVLAFFYLIIGLIFNKMKTKWFQTPIGDMLVKKMFK